MTLGIASRLREEEAAHKRNAVAAKTVVAKAASVLVKEAERRVAARAGAEIVRRMNLYGCQASACGKPTNRLM